MGRAKKKRVATMKRRQIKRRSFRHLVKYHAVHVYSTFAYEIIRAVIDPAPELP